jgi:hypothetical protein
MMGNSQSMARVGYGTGTLAIVLQNDVGRKGGIYGNARGSVCEGGQIEGRARHGHDAAAPQPPNDEKAGAAGWNCAKKGEAAAGRAACAKNEGAACAGGRAFCWRVER